MFNGLKQQSFIITAHAPVDKLWIGWTSMGSPLIPARIVLAFVAQQGWEYCVMYFDLHLSGQAKLSHL